jgi:glycosyltransferase involved in cell wall biosynthesis
MRHQIDLVHSFGRLAALLPILPLHDLPKVQTYQRDRLPEKGVRRAVRLAGDSLRFTACATHMYTRANLAGQWATVFNGVDLSKYAFVPTVAADSPLVFLGRLERFKGVHNAVRIAASSGRRLVIAGNQVRSGADATYFDDEIAPALDGDRVRYVGPVDDVQKSKLLGESTALLMPIEWEEPFGIVMAEAMACGTPVIAFARGSVPEVVRHGVNGFVCNNVAEAASLVTKLGNIDRATVRQDAESRFSSETIVSAYEAIYREAIAATSKEEKN